MNREDAFSMGLPPRQDQEASRGFGPWEPGPGGFPDPQAAPAAAPSTPLRMWPLLELLAHRWGWLFLSGVALAIAAGAAGLRFWQTSYTAAAQLIYYESPNATEVFHPRPTTLQTLASLLRSPELLQRVAAQARPPVSPARLGANLLLVPERGAEVIQVMLSGSNPSETLDLANLYAGEAVRFSQQTQAKDAAEVNRFLKDQMAQTESEIHALNEQLRSLPPSALQSLSHPGQLAVSLETARAELAGLLARYTEAWPAVQQQRAKIAELEKSLLAESKPAAPAASAGIKPLSNAVPASTVTSDALSPKAPQTQDAVESLSTRLQVLETARLQLAGRQRAAREFEEHPPGFFRVLAPASPEQMVRHDRRVKVVASAVLGGVVGVVAAMGLVLLVEVSERRLKNAADVERVTGLPLLASLGNLRKMSPADQERWAFRTWTILQGRLSRSPNHGLVCGFTSSVAGEGRSTWVQLLARAASSMGFRVLTIATRSSGADDGTLEPESKGKGVLAPPPPDLSAVQASAPPAPDDASSQSLQQSDNPTLQHSITPSLHHSITPSLQPSFPNVLASPLEVTQKLTGPHSQPLVHIPLPGWVWNLERRKQWQSALHDWRQIDNIVILVELPPADVTEAVLLGENLPQMVWLTGSGRADAARTRSQLDLLRHARCRLAGAVLNFAPNHALKNRFARWVGCVTVGLVLALQSGCQTQPHDHSDSFTTPSSADLTSHPNLNLNLNRATTPNPQPSTLLGAPSAPSAPSDPSDSSPSSDLPPAQTNFSLSASAARPRAAWQQHLTLGPGDLLNFSIFDQPDLTRTDVLIGPDGRVSYLQAQDIMAAGLTVDELRARFDQELGKYLRAPRTIITPAAFHSKKFFMLGAVVHPGVVSLDRPMTIIEAVAQAKGLETGLFANTTRELADLSRSFLVRAGRPLPVNFEKLFQGGDLSQNIPVEPNDYLFFPAARLQDVFVLGEVTQPGVVGFDSGLGALAAISMRGGFTERAWKARVLVVRGSLHRPEAFTVDAADVLSAKSPDFRLQPKDIVYVSSRPWIKGEELLDAAVSAFVQAAIIIYAGENIGSLRLQ